MATQGRSLRMFIVDSFTEQAFHGNPAAVCLVPHDYDIGEELRYNIAAEMNLSETAFVKLTDQADSEKTGNSFGLRWFTPTSEVPLCGHATLASAAVLFFVCGNESSELSFSTLSGIVKAKRQGQGIVLDFPLNTTQPLDKTEVESVIKEVCDPGLISDIHYSPTTKKLVLRLQDSLTRADLERLSVDPRALKATEGTGKVMGVIVTLKGSRDNGSADQHGEQYDFVSRYFAPWVGIPEDPATGAAHTVLADYWRKGLGKDSFYARQCSPRGGDLRVRVRGDRVELEGRAIVVLRGHIDTGNGPL